MKKYQNNFYLFIIHVLIQKEHNRQQVDDWLWDTIPNTVVDRWSIFRPLLMVHWWLTVFWGHFSRSTMGSHGPMRDRVATDDCGHDRMAASHLKEIRDVIWCDGIWSNDQSSIWGMIEWCRGPCGADLTVEKLLESWSRCNFDAIWVLGPLRGPVGEISEIRVQCVALVDR